MNGAGTPGVRTESRHGGGLALDFVERQDIGKTLRVVDLPVEVHDEPDAGWIVAVEMMLIRDVAAVCFVELRVAERPERLAARGSVGWSHEQVDIAVRTQSRVGIMRARDRRALDQNRGDLRGG